jgi:hypothetical protein
MKQFLCVLVTLYIIVGCTYMQVCTGDVDVVVEAQL